MALAYLLDPNQQLFTRGGVLNVGGLIKVYLNGTDDPAVTYSDFEGTVNPFPVVLDSNGRAVVIADESMAYRVEVYGADGDLLWTSYPVVPRTYTQNDFTDADKEKLDGIEEGAQKNVKSDWNATSGDAEILNKPNLGDYAEKDELAQVAFSGSYDDLEDRPEIPAPQVNSDWNSVTGVSKILNKPNLSPVATSGSYNDLSDTPNIPPAQVNSDWNANAGVSEILNKPDIPGMAQTTADALCELKANIEAVEADIPPAQIQADYAQADPNAVDFVRHKPDLSLKEDKSNKAVGAVDPTSTTEYPSSKAMTDYVDTAIATNSGKYISDNGSPFTSAGDLPTDSSVSNNDYAVVLTGGIYYRYKATVIGSTVSWAMEYAINTNAFTPAQQAAIDSTITSAKVGNYDAHLANTTIHVTQTNKDTWNAKQNAIGDLGTIRSGAQAGSTAVQPPTLAEKAEVTAAALCELKENVQGVEEDIPDVTVYARIADLAAVAFSGDYDDLEDKPDLSVFALSSSLATVATSGSYNDLTDTPTIPPVLSAGDGIGISSNVISRKVQFVTTSSTYSAIRHILDEGDVPVLDVANGSYHNYFFPTHKSGTHVDFVGSMGYNTYPTYESANYLLKYSVDSNNAWTVSKYHELPYYTGSDAYKALFVNSIGNGVEWGKANADWSASSGPSAILNKPITIPNATGGLRKTLTADDITNGYVEFLVRTSGVYSGDQAFTDPTFFLCSTMEQFRYNSGYVYDYIDTVEVGLYSPGIVSNYKKYYEHTHAEVVADFAKGWGLTGWWTLTKDNYLSVYVRMRLTSAAVEGATISAHFTSAIFGSGLFPY